MNDNDHVASIGLYACYVCCCITPPPFPMCIYGLRAAQNGRLWVFFFVTRYRDLFWNQGGRSPGRTQSPNDIHPWCKVKDQVLLWIKSWVRNRARRIKYPQTTVLFFQVKKRLL